MIVKREARLDGECGASPPASAGSRVNPVSAWEFSRAMKRCCPRVRIVAEQSARGFAAHPFSATRT
jgi:hypothetical protein